MKKVDRRICEALLEGDEGESLLNEPDLTEELLQILRGRDSGAKRASVAASLVLLGVAIWAGLQFYPAVDVKSLFSWGGLCLLSVLGISLVKIYFWIDMHSNRVARELKRIKLLLVTQRQQDGGRGVPGADLVSRALACLASLHPLAG